MMTETEHAILETLAKLEAAVKAKDGKTELLPLFSRLDQLADQVAPTAAPELLHYLRKKSYEKARLWLESRQSEIQRGGCRGD